MGLLFKHSITTAFIKAALVFCFPIALAGAAGCGGDGDRPAVVETMEANLDSLQAGVAENRDEEFVEDMLEDNVQLTAILYDGTKMGTDAGLKREAQHMLTDHEALGKRLQQMARVKGFETDEVSKSDSAMQRSNDRRGREWDADWADVIARRHREMLNRLDDFSDDTKDADILAFINDARPNVATHLATAEALEIRLDKR